MNVSELVTTLQNILTQNGDMPVKDSTGTNIDNIEIVEVQDGSKFLELNEEGIHE